MLLATLGASVLGNILSGRERNKKGQGIVRPGYGHHSSRNKNNKRDF